MTRPLTLLRMAMLLSAELVPRSATATATATATASATASATATASASECPRGHVCELASACAERHAGAAHRLAARLVFVCDGRRGVCCPPIDDVGTQGRRYEKWVKTEMRRASNRQLFGSDCGKSFPQRIHGGKEVEPGEYPWMARVGYVDANGERVFRCGGTLISKRYVLTAAHCLVQDGVPVDAVRLGETDTTKDPDCPDSSNADRVTVHEEENADGAYDSEGTAYDLDDDQYADYNDESTELTRRDLPVETCFVPKVLDLGVDEVVSHKRYSRTTSLNDIALLRLDRALDRFSEFVAPICLPWEEQSMPTNFIIVGWGLNENGDESSALQRGRVTQIPMEDCQDSIDPRDSKRVTPELVTASQVCTAPKRGDSNACMGDSGGPLSFLNFTLDSEVQVGIVSFGQSGECATAVESFTVYTKISAYTDWILKKVRP